METDYWPGKIQVLSREGFFSEKDAAISAGAVVALDGFIKISTVIKQLENGHKKELIKELIKFENNNLPIIDYNELVPKENDFKINQLDHGNDFILMEPQPEKGAILDGIMYWVDNEIHSDEKITAFFKWPEQMVRSFGVPENMCDGFKGCVLRGDENPLWYFEVEKEMILRKTDESAIGLYFQDTVIYPSEYLVYNGSEWERISCTDKVPCFSLADVFRLMEIMSNDITFTGNIMSDPYSGLMAKLATDLIDDMESNIRSQFVLKDETERE